MHLLQYNYILFINGSNWYLLLYDVLIHTSPSMILLRESLLTGVLNEWIWVFLEGRPKTRVHNECVVRVGRERSVDVVESSFVLRFSETSFSLSAVASTLYHITRMAVNTFGSRIQLRDDLDDLKPCHFSERRNEMSQSKLRLPWETSYRLEKEAQCLLRGLR